MNKQQRENLSKIVSAMEAIGETEEHKALGAALVVLENAIKGVEDAAGHLATIVRQFESDVEDELSDEQDKYDNMPESLQNGERGEAMQYAIDALESARSDLDQLADSLETWDINHPEGGTTELMDYIETELSSATDNINEATSS